MSFASFLARPILRLPLVAATVAATVATTPAAWSLEDRTEPRGVRVETGATVEVRVDVEGSLPPDVDLDLEKLIAREGTLRIEATDSRSSCTTSTTYVSDDGIWRATPAARSSELHRIHFDARCSTTETHGTVTFRFVNAGATPLDFTWSAVTSIRDLGDDAPDGAFVRVEVLP